MKEYVAYFVYSEPEYQSDKTLGLRRILEDEWLGVYHCYCELVNPKYAEWNEEFNKMGLDMNQYNDFIRERQKPLVKQAAMKYGFFLDYDVDEECQLTATLLDAVCRLLNVPKTRMDLYIKEKES